MRHRSCFSEHATPSALDAALAQAAMAGDAAGAALLLAQGADRFAPMAPEPGRDDFLRRDGIWCDPRGWLCLSMGSDSGITPLMAAARQGHAECVAALACPRSARQRSARGQTALMLALARGSLPCAMLLAELSDLGAVSQGGWSAMSIASKMAELGEPGHADAAARMRALAQRSLLGQACRSPGASRHGLEAARL